MGKARRRANAHREPLSPTTQTVHFAANRSRKKFWDEFSYLLDGLGEVIGVQGTASGKTHQLIDSYTHLLSVISMPSVVNDLQAH